MEDVTDFLLREISSSPNPIERSMGKAPPAKLITTSLSDTIMVMQGPGFDCTMGFVSNPLLYSKLFRHRPKSFHRNVIRLIKGGFLRVWKHDGFPPVNSTASEDNPRGNYWYELVMDTEKYGEFVSHIHPR